MPDPLPPITTERSVLADQVYRSVCQHIVMGHFQPGERLREAETAEALGVSRTPVREAFARLQRQRLLSQDASGAYHIPVWDKQMVWEMATLRGVLEGLAVRLACPNLTAGDFLELESLHAAMLAAQERGDIDQTILKDLAFHSYLWSRCGHKLLQTELQNLKDQIAYFMFSTLPSAKKSSTGGHSVLLDLLRNGEAEKAQQTIQEHILAYAERAKTWIENQNQDIP